MASIPNRVDWVLGMSERGRQVLLEPGGIKSKLRAPVARCDVIINRCRESERGSQVLLEPGGLWSKLREPISSRCVSDSQHRRKSERCCQVPLEPGGVARGETKAPGTQGPGAHQDAGGGCSSNPPPPGANGDKLFWIYARNVTCWGDRCKKALRGDWKQYNLVGLSGHH
eukprot:8935742-Pyramimonas_sp.AAC.1